MNEEDLKKEGLRSMKEFDMAWEEFFRNKPEPKTDEADRKQQEEFYQWYNYVRKQSDTGKTPAEMYKDRYGEEPKNLSDETKPSRFMNFGWDEEYSEEEIQNALTETADHLFDKGVWQDCKERVKNMSKRDSSRYMFRLGFFMHYQYMDEQMKKLSDMPEEEAQKIIDDYKKKESKI